MTYISEHRRALRLAAETIDGETSAEDLETILRARRARITIAGKGGSWACVAWLDENSSKTTRGEGETWWEAVREALKI